MEHSPDTTKPKNVNPKDRDIIASITETLDNYDSYIGALGGLPCVKTGIELEFIHDN